MTLRRLGLAVGAVLAVLACSSGDDGDRAGPTTTAARPASEEPTTTVPTYTGDPGSPFCEVLAGADDRPVLDPFESGLDPGEIELRIRTLLVRFDDLVALAPPEIVADVERVATGLLALDEALGNVDYDLAAAGEAGIDLSFLDAPEFVDVGARIAAYETQVCDG